MTLVSSTHVSAWKDKSASALSFAQATDGKRPILTAAAQNGKSAVAFTRANNSRVVNSSTTIISSTTAFTIFFVGKMNSYGAGNHAYAINLGTNTDGIMVAYFSANTGPNLGSSNASWVNVKSTTALASDTGWHYITYGFTGSSATSTTSYSISFDGAAKVVAAGVGDSSGSNANTIGNYADSDDTTNSWDGLMGEILVYGRLLTAGETAMVHAYLSAKWGI